MPCLSAQDSELHRKNADKGASHVAQGRSTDVLCPVSIINTGFRAGHVVTDGK